MSEIVVEVIGVEPPCPKCRKTLEIVKNVVKELNIEDKVKIIKLDINSPNVVARYGVISSPSVAVNGVIKVLGRVPEKEEVIRILKEAVQSHG